MTTVTGQLVVRSGQVMVKDWSLNLTFKHYRERYGFQSEGFCIKERIKLNEELIRVHSFRGQSWAGWSEVKEDLRKAREVEGFREGCKAGGRSGRIS
jgi:hypothetical protein